MKRFDLTEINIQELEFYQQFKLKINGRRASYNAIAAWFTVFSTQLD